MTFSYKILFAISLFTLIFSFGLNNSISQVTDYDGKTYNTVTIGTQEWMAENLNVEHYRNGDIIPQIQDNEKWNHLVTGAWRYYDNDSKKGKKYGKLYNWYAVIDSRGLAPDGWHIPSDDEWTELNDYLGGGRGVEEKLKSNSGWYHNSNGTNESGFGALPGGFCYGNGEFHEISKYCYFWSTLEYKDKEYKSAWCRYLDDVNSTMLRNACYKDCGLSIRCIKN